MSGSRNGFTFIELMVAIVIIGIMATFIVPPFFRQAAPPIDTFASELNNLIRTGILDAIETDRVHRIYFDFVKTRISLETATKKVADADLKSARYVAVQSVAAPTVVDLPEDDVLRVVHFYIGATEERMPLNFIYFFIGADGTVQDVTIVLLDVETKLTKTLMINPFSGQLVIYEGSRKP